MGVILMMIMVMGKKPFGDPGGCRTPPPPPPAVYTYIALNGDEL